MVSMKPKKHSGKEHSEETHCVQCTNSITLENDLGASMTHVHLKVLYPKNGQGNIARLEAGFVACSSYAIWDTGTKCYKNQLTEMLNSFCNGVLVTVPLGSLYKNLVNTLVIDVQTQRKSMCTFIDSFYVELTGATGFNKDKAWKLVGPCVAALFSSLQPYRSLVGRLEDIGIVGESKAACIWAVLQCHCVLGMISILSSIKDIPLFLKR
jgi:hypothetical protein